MSKALDPDRGFVRIREGQIHYRKVGEAANGVPLICLHASPASSTSLIPLLQALQGAHFAMAFDTLGNGESDPPQTAAPTLTDYATAMDAACAALGFDQVHVYGNHTGAHIAVEWAILNPDRVKRVVLDQVAILSADERAEFLEQYAPPKRPDEMGTQFYWAWQFMRDQMLFAPHYKKSAQTLHQSGVFDADTLHMLTMDLLRALETYHLSYRAVFAQDLAARLPHVAVPVLATCPANADEDASVSFLKTHLKDVTFAPLPSEQRTEHLVAGIGPFLSS